MVEKVDVAIQSIFGAEKVVVQQAGDLAKRLGLNFERIEDLKTAVAEACLNAIEHGNKFDRDKDVDVTFTVEDTVLKVIVRDKGNGIDPKKIPSQRIDPSGFPLRRGYGIFLIKNFVNEFSFEAKPGEGNAVTMIINLERGSG
jgi:serine/threonine-protein kinase RsbW